MADELDEAELEQLEADMKKANKFFEDFSKGRFDRLEGLMEAILQKLDKLDRKMESSGTGSKSGFNVGSSSNTISTVHNRKSGIPMVQSINYAQPLAETVPMAFPGVDGGSITDSFLTLTVEDDYVPVTFVANPSFPLLQDPALCDLKRVELGFLLLTVSYPSHFISIFRDGHKLDDGHNGVLFLHPYSVPIMATTHFNEIFLCLSQTAKSIEVWTSNQFIVSVIFIVLDYHDLALLQSIIYRSKFDPGISFPLALLLKCSICVFQGLCNESEEFNGYGINLNKEIAQLWFLTCCTCHLELEVGPTITIFYYAHYSFLPFTTRHCSSYSWDDGYVESKLLLLLILTVTNQLLGILLFGDTFVIPSIYLSFSILMFKPHKVPNMFSSFISVFDPGISVRVSFLVEVGAYYHFSCWNSCLANIPYSMKFINESTTTLIGALTWDTIFSKSLWFHYLPSFQSHARFLSELITWFHATFIEPCTYFIFDVLEWGLKMHKDFVDYGRLYVGALIISTVMLLFTGMADLSIISGLFLVHFKQRDLLLYSAWAYEIVENAGSTSYVEIITAAAILIVVFASCLLVMLYKLMSFCFAKVLVVLFCIGGIEGLQTCLVVLLSCFRWFQLAGQTFVKVPFPGAISYFTLSRCIDYINWTTPHISKGIGAQLAQTFTFCFYAFMLLISAVVPSACLGNSTWNSLDFPHMASLFWVIVQGWYFRIIYASSTLASLFF